MKVSREVLEVLSAIECDGREARIVERLARGAYTAVDKVLVACGGKWDRRVRAHVFPRDAQEAIDAVLVAGEVETARDVGWFPTPPEVAERLIGTFVRPGMVVLEPSAGEGALVVPMLRRGAHVTAIERDDGRRSTLAAATTHEAILGAWREGEPQRGSFEWARNADGSICRDFMEHRGRLSPAGGGYDAVVMNPPFCKVGLGDHLDHVRHAASLLRPGGVVRAILPSGVEWRRDRRHEEFRRWLTGTGPAAMIERLPEGSFKASGTGVSTVIVTVWR